MWYIKIIVSRLDKIEIEEKEWESVRYVIEKAINHRGRHWTRSCSRCFGLDAAGETTPRGGALYSSSWAARGRHCRIKGRGFCVPPSVVGTRHSSRSFNKRPVTITRIVLITVLMRQAPREKLHRVYGQVRIRNKFIEQQVLSFKRPCLSNKLHII